MLKPAELPASIAIIKDAQTLKTLLSHSSRPLLVMAGAAWCPDTKRMLTEALPPIMEKYGDRIDFACAIWEKDECDIPETYGVERYPTLLLFSGGSLANKKISEGSLDEQIADLEGLAQKAS